MFSYSSRKISICANKSFNFRIIISTFQIIHACFIIIIISLIAERILNTYCICQLTCNSNHFSPTVRSIFYYHFSICVNKGNDVTLYISYIKIGDSPDSHKDQIGLGVITVPDDSSVSFLRKEKISCPLIFSHCIVYCFFHSGTNIVVKIFNTLSIFYTGKPASLCPGISCSSSGKHISNGIISHCCAIPAQEFILPCTVISFCHCLHRCIRKSFRSRKCVLFFYCQITTQIIGISDGFV